MINEGAVIFISLEDWGTTYPLTDELFNITHVTEFTTNDDVTYAAFVWNDFKGGQEKKILSLIKMPPQIEAAYNLEHHEIPHSDKMQILDIATADTCILLLCELKNEVSLVQFTKTQGTANFLKINSFKDDRHSYMIASIVPQTYINDPVSLEISVDVNFVYQRCLELGTFEFTNNSEAFGTEAHSEKFNEYIVNISKNKLLKSPSGGRNHNELFSDDEIQDLLASGYFEYIGGNLLFKQPGMDGYSTNMADLRDFIEKWVGKMQSRVNNRILPAVLKHFKPETYGRASLAPLDLDHDLPSKLKSAQKSVESLAKLYKYILHRRIIEGKEKQKNLKQDRLNIKDIEDIKMIDRRCVQVESNLRFLKYLTWFVKNSSFFIRYPDLVNEVQRKISRKRSEKKQHYRENLEQVIKNYVVSDTLFIDKIFEESGIRSESPKAAYGSILKNSKFSDIKREEGKGEEDTPVDISYPLKDIEEFIVLLKATSLTKIQDYIILYTLLDMHYDKNEASFSELLQSLDLYQNYKEVKTYWNLDSAYISQGSEKAEMGLVDTDNTGDLQWHTSILQSVLELDNQESFNTYLTTPELAQNPRNSVELAIYGLCKSGKYNQAFQYLLQLEDQINPIRYKNVFKLFTNQMLNDHKFELLTSYPLTDKQFDIVGDYLKSDESGLQQLFYFSFMSSRGSILDGLQYAKQFIDKLKRDKIDANRVGKDEAQFVYDVLKNMMRMYAH